MRESGAGGGRIGWLLVGIAIAACGEGDGSGPYLDTAPRPKDNPASDPVLFERDFDDGRTLELRRQDSMADSGTQQPVELPEPDAEIELGAVVTAMVYDSESDRIHALSRSSAELLLIDGASEQVVSRTDLEREPGDLCISQHRERVFVAAADGSAIAELALLDHEIIGEITWGAPEPSHEAARVRARCTRDSLYLADASSAPGLWRVRLDSPAVVSDLSATLSGVGALAVASDALSLYYVQQQSWEETSAESSLIRVSTLDFSELDSTRSGEELSHDPVRAPLVLSTLGELIGTRHLLYNPDDLRQRRARLAEGENLLAVDATHSLLVTDLALYRLPDYRMLSLLPADDVVAGLFDDDGRLYLLSESATNLLVVAPPE